MVEEARREANVPAEQPAPQEAARVPPPHVDPRGSRGAAGTAREGSAPPVGVIWRVRDRSTFARLRRDGVRVREGPLWVSFVPAEDATVPPRVAFAIGRKVGHAVERNRAKRRLRSVFAELAGRATGLRPGAYLVGATSDIVTLPYPEIREHVERALNRIDQRIARP